MQRVHRPGGPGGINVSHVFFPLPNGLIFCRRNIPRAVILVIIIDFFFFKKKNCILKNIKSPKIVVNGESINVAIRKSV